MFFRWVRFQGPPTYTGANDNPNGALLLKFLRLRRWHLHTEYLAGSAATISLTYLANKNSINGLFVRDYAHILQYCVNAPAGLIPQDYVLDFGEDGFPLPLVNVDGGAGGYIYFLTIYTSTNTLTGGFLLSELEFTFDCPYGILIRPTFVN